MKNSIKLHAASIVLAVLIFLGISSNSFAQTEADESLRPAFSLLTGTFELDLSKLGHPNQDIKFYIDNEILMVDTGEGYHLEMTPVDKKKSEFIVEDPHHGNMTYTFQQDKDGTFNSVIVKIDMLDIELPGTRIDGYLELYS